MERKKKSSNHTGVSKLPDGHLFEIRLLQMGFDEADLLAITNISRG